jgi:hypothetical protein
LSFPWRVTELLAESWYNVTVRGSRLRLVAIAALATGSCLAALSAIDWSSLRDDVAGLRAAGWNAVVVEAPSGAGISPRSCERAGQLAGVIHTFGVTSSSDDMFVETGGSSIPVVTMTVSADSGLFGRKANHALPVVLLGADLARRYDDHLGVLHSRRWTTGLPVAGTLPNEPLFADYRSSVVLLLPFEGLPGGLLHRCEFDVDPSVVRAVAPRLAAAVDASDLTLTTRWLGPDLPLHPFAQFERRTSRAAFPAAGFLLGLLYLAVLRARASELGTYRCSGTSRRELASMLAFEATFLCGIMVASGVAATAALVALDHADAAASAGRMLTAWACCTLTCCVAAVHAARRPVLALLKDR